MIKFENISKRFGKLTVFDKLDLDIDRSGIVSILGPNASGKTTLIKMLLGMVIPNSGNIIYNDKSILKDWNYRKDISYLPQIAHFPENLRVKELISLVKNIRQQDSDEQELIDLFKLESSLDKKLGHLSGGTVQKVNLTLCFMFDSPIIVLDEPSNGLDPMALVSLKDLILREKEKGKLILLTTHIMSLVEELSERIVFLLEGDIVFDGTNEELKMIYGTNNIERALAKLLDKRYVENIKI